MRRISRDVSRWISEIESESEQLTASTFASGMTNIWLGWLPIQLHYIMLMISRRSPSTTDGIRSSVCPYLFESDEKTATANASTASQMEKYIPFRVGC